MSTISSLTLTNSNVSSLLYPSPIASFSQIPIFQTTFSPKPFQFLHPLSFSKKFDRKTTTTITQIFCKSPEAAEDEEEEEPSILEDKWLQKLPEKTKPLYSHSLPCIEAWLKSLGFQQSKADRAMWQVHKPDWHAHLSLDITDLNIRYLKSGPGNLDKDMERRFSYALSREDIENAVLGGP